MAIRLPSDKDLQEMAQANHFELNDQEIEAFQALIPGMLQSYEQVYQMPDPREPNKYPERDPGRRPSRQDDPFNAIIRYCSLSGAASGKLAGKRIGLKNNICVAGMPTTNASLVMEDFVADTDATIVTRLLDEGAEIAALLNLENFSFSVGNTSTFGPVLNPHNPEHIAGGSSGGSGAALYYDEIDITIGGDQGGSIRIPAGWCGVVGLKPTHGLVPYTGIFGIDQTIDHTGPMARTVADAALTLEVIAGKDPLDPRQGEVHVQPYTEFLGRGVDGIRIGVVSEGFGRAASEPDVDAAVRKALGHLGELGADIVEMSVPEHIDAVAIGWPILIEGAAALIAANGMGYHWQGLYNPALVESVGKSLRAQGNDLPPSLKLVLLTGTYMRQKYHGSMYAKAQNLRRVARAAYDRALEQFDVLAMPTSPMKAPREDELGVLNTDLYRVMEIAGNTAPFDTTGHPALTVPCGKSEGLPVGLMLVGKHFDDGKLFQVAHAFEQNVNWETF